MKAKFAMMISSKQCNLYRHFRATCLVAIWACVFSVVLPDEQSWAQLDSKPQADPRAEYIRANYTKSEVRIRMRDGVELFTSIYSPNDPDPSKKYPILLSRTPYSVGPYGLSAYKTRLGPSPEFEKNRYIFVFQDVRGRYMSGGEFVNMRPHVPKVAGSGSSIDESTDTYDTIEYLVKSLPGNNGSVGQWGISYPGFYTSAGAIDSHPALKAVSPQAPIADWFFDDFHRNGAFVLPMGFSFFSSFGKARPVPTTESASGFQFPTRDGYQFYLDLGSLSNVDAKYFKDEIGFWNDIEAHPNYDSFWQARNILPHLKNIKAAVLTVGGWYDTEDLYGPLATYAAIEKQNPGIQNGLVMGPWYHGQWASDDGSKLGQAEFGFPTSVWYQQNVLLPFFEHYLRGAGNGYVPEMTAFETGANRWRQFPKWPPAEVVSTSYYFGQDGLLTNDTTKVAKGADSFPSDPRKPVPYTMEITNNWARDYVTEDQRFASWRPDVLVFRSEVLKDSVTLAGPIPVELWVTSTQSDADWVVKVVDEYPGVLGSTGRNRDIRENINSGRQELVRAGVIRGRFRDGFDDPKPMVPGEPTRVRFELSDIFHTFQPGHRIMIQVQSSWFPFIDRNPQKYVENIFLAKDEDFQSAIHSLLRGPDFPSRIALPILR
ncbi:MAG: CocE/NonD family hydrolase [Planctomycetota bacterium]